MSLTDDAGLVSAHRQPAIHAASAWLSRTRAEFQHMATIWLARRRHAREAEVLHAFSDRELWDLGLSRSDIPGIIDGTYRRD